jgi:hypothetical protein
MALKLGGGRKASGLADPRWDLHPHPQPLGGQTGVCKGAEPILTGLVRGRNRASCWCVGWTDNLDDRMGTDLRVMSFLVMSFFPFSSQCRGGRGGDGKGT